MSQNTQMNHVPLIELFRGATLECQHLGSVAVVNTDGRLIAHAGNPHWLSFTRSTLKALQALPFMEADGPQAFELNSQQLALLCASHSGEDKHVAIVTQILEKVGKDHRALRCGCHVPGIFSYHDKAPPADLHYDQRHNNCSGKHAGFIAYCVQHGLALDSYLDPSHPLQKAIRRDVARVAGLDESALAMGIDGCSAPNYAMPLASLAKSYARLANGGKDAEFGSSFQQLAQAMTEHPDLVSGTGRSDLAFIAVGRGDWVTKVGADGVQVVGSKSRAEAFAIKILDANKAALYAATVEVLDQLGWLDAGQRTELEPWRSAAIVNVNGIQVGDRRPSFQLATR